MRGGASVLCMALAVLLLASPAAAWAGESALAETLYQDGRALLARGRTAEACAKFEESLRLDQATGTLLNLAVCHEDLGKIATAWAEFQAAAASASHDGREDRTRFAREHLARIEPRLSYLVISVAADVKAISGLEIALDATVLGAPSWNLGLPIDPGTHVVVARAAGYVPLSQTVTVGANPARHAVVVKMVPLPAGKGDVASVQPPAAVAPVLPAAKADVPDASPASTSGSQQLSRMKVASYALTVGGGTALLVGAFFGVRAFSQWNLRNGQCPTDDTCSPAGVAYHDQARTAALVADVTVGVGVAAMALGAYLFHRAHAQAEEAKPAGALSLRPTAVSVTPSGMAMGWAW